MYQESDKVKASCFIYWKRVAVCRTYKWPNRRCAVTIFITTITLLVASTVLTLFSVKYFKARIYLGRKGRKIETEQVSETKREIRLHKCGDFLCASEYVARRGLLVVAYSMDETLLHTKFMREARVLARSFKAHNPYPVCLVTNALTAEAESADIFDYYIHVRADHIIRGEERSGGYKPQWLTRLLYLSSTPFETTLTADSDAGFCGSVERHFDTLESFDFVVSNHIKDHVPSCSAEYPHNFMLGYSMNRHTSVLFSNWLHEQTSIGSARDDQRPLFNALATTRAHLGSKFKLGYFSSSFGCSLMHHNDVDFSSFLPATSKVLSTFVPVVHPVQSVGLHTSELSLSEGLQAMCVLINRYPEKVRMLVKTTFDVGGISIVYSDQECAKVTGVSTCAGKLNNANRTACGFQFEKHEFDFHHGTILNKKYVNEAVFT